MANNTNQLTDIKNIEVEKLVSGLYDLAKAFNSATDSILKFTKNTATLYANLA